MIIINKKQKYWQKRAEQISNRQFETAEEYANTLRKEYDKASNSIKRNIESFFARYAEDNAVSMTEAKKLLNTKELKEYRLTLEEFIEKAKDNADGRWTRQLQNQYYRVRIERYEALLTQIRQQTELLAHRQHGNLEGAIEEIYSDTYYRTLHAIEDYTGPVNFSTIDHQTMEKILNTNLSGDNWSNRIWRNREQLVREVHTKLSQAFIRGDSSSQTTKGIARSMEVSYRKAYRLIHTETTFISGQATLDGYKEANIDRYEFMASWNERTCPTCGALDGKVFKVSEQEPGINMQPIHPHCHCTTVPHFDDEFNPETGEIEATRQGTNYEDWKQERIGEIGQQEWDIRQKMLRNESADKDQHLRYKEALGKDAPKSFADFQKVKYSNENEYGILKAQAKGMGYYNKAVANEAIITEHVKGIAEKSNMDIEGLQYRLKAKDSYLEKIRREYDPGNNTYEIKDIIRYTYTANSDELTVKTLKAIDDHNNMGYNTIEIKNYWLDMDNPYNGINTIVASPSGQKFELQYHTPESFAVKNGEMHKLYEKWRSLPKNSKEGPEIEKAMKKLSDSMTAPKNIERVK